MGTWGAGIFDNDLASDIRDVYLVTVAEGSPAEQAALQTQTRFSSVLHDSDESIVFWLALAAIQRHYGHVTDAVKNEALRVIASGLDEQRWKDASPENQQTRKQVLQELRAKLTT